MQACSILCQHISSLWVYPDDFPIYIVPFCQLCVSMNRDKSYFTPSQILVFCFFTHVSPLKSLAHTLAALAFALAFPVPEIYKSLPTPAQTAAPRR